MEIEFTKEVVFKDCTGATVKVYNVGDRVEYIYKSSTYWVTTMGGIYFDEAAEVTGETL